MSEEQVGGMTVIEDGDMVSATRDTPPVEAPEPEPDAEPEPVPEPEPVATKTEGEDEPEPEPAADRDDKGRFKKPAEKKVASIQAKIDELTYRRREEERRVSELERRRQTLEADTQPRTEPDRRAEPAAPISFQDFAKDYQAKHPDNTSYEVLTDEYLKVRDAYLLENFQKTQAAAEDARQLAEATDSHRVRMAEAIAAIPDWKVQSDAADSYLAQRGFPQLPELMKLAILRSPRSEKIVVDLTQHPEIAFQVALDAKDLPVTPAAVKMVRTVLESRLSATPAPASGPGIVARQSRSNVPPKPVGSSPIASEPSSDDIPYEGPGGMLERVTKVLHRR